jgi:hypothetical protein
MTRESKAVIFQIYLYIKESEWPKGYLGVGRLALGNESTQEVGNNEETPLHFLSFPSCFRVDMYRRLKSIFRTFTNSA